MVSLEQVRHTIDLLSLLEKATGKYPEPKVKPPSAVKYDWNWNADTGHWVSENGEEHEEESSKLQENDIQVDPNAEINPELLPQKQSGPKGISATGYSQEGFRTVIKEVIQREHDIEQDPSYTPFDDNGVLQAYTASIHHRINDSIRNGYPDEDAKELKAMMKPMGKKGVLYRSTGVRMQDLGIGDLTVGNSFQLKSFASTSRNPGFAWDWQMVNDEEYDIQEEDEMQKITKDDMSVFLELHHDEITNGATLSNSDTDLDEYETILDYGQNFKIERIDWIEVGENSYNIPAETQKPVIVARFTDSLGMTNDFGFSKNKFKVKPPFAEEHGFEWDENKKRWVQLVGV